MVEISSKELIRSLFQLKELPRTPFIPWVGTFAAQLEQIQAEEMLSDPGLLSNSLLNAQKLFGYDAIVPIFDQSLEAEACGCEIEWPEEGGTPRVTSHPIADGASVGDIDKREIEKLGRVPIVLDALKRMNILRGRQVAFFAVVTGPLTLASHLMGDGFIGHLEAGSEQATKTLAAAGSVGLKLSRKYCEAGVDAVVMAEPMLATANTAVYKPIAGPMKSIWNVTKFFGVRTLVLSTGCSNERIEPVLDLQADGVALGAKVGQERLAQAALNRKACYGTTVQVEGDEGTIGTVGERDGRGHFLTTDWEVPYETDVNAMHRVMAAIKR